MKLKQVGSRLPLKGKQNGLNLLFEIMQTLRDKQILSRIKQGNEGFSYFYNSYININNFGVQ